MIIQNKGTVSQNYMVWGYDLRALHFLLLLSTLKVNFKFEFLLYTSNCAEN